MSMKSAGNVLLARALDFHGFVDILDQQQYKGSKNADWKALGVD